VKEVKAFRQAYDRRIALSLQHISEHQIVGASVQTPCSKSKTTNQTGIRNCSDALGDVLRVITQANQPAAQ
jgi:hypothetical protein